MKSTAVTSLSTRREDLVGRQRVLRAAKSTFIRDGSSKFSARAVAKEARVSLRAVQHFFPTTEVLLAGVLEFVANEFRSSYEQLFTALPFNGEARLLGVVDILLDANWQQETRQFFYGLYSLSCHNEYAAVLTDRLMTQHLQMFATLIGGARPNLSEKRCFALAAHVAATIDGSMLMTAPGNKQHIGKRALAKVVRESLLTLIAAPEPE